MYETFTHLAPGTGDNLPEARLREAHRILQRPRSDRGKGGTGVAESREALLSPLGGDQVLRESDVQEGQFGDELTDRALAIAVGRRTWHMPHRGDRAGVIEALPYVDSDGATGWFFYGWLTV